MAGPGRARQEVKTTGTNMTREAASRIQSASDRACTGGKGSFAARAQNAASRNDE